MNSTSPSRCGLIEPAKVEPSTAQEQLGYGLTMVESTILFQRSSRGVGVWVFGALAIIFFIALLGSILSGDFGRALIDFVVTGAFAAAAWFFNQRERNQSVALRGDRLVARDGSNDPIEIPISSARAMLATETGGDVAMPRRRRRQSQERPHSCHVAMG